MKTTAFRSLAIFLGAAAVTAMAGGPVARASDKCPCLTGGAIDGWFTQLGLSSTAEREMFLCVDDAGLLTLDYFDRTARHRAIYADITYATSNTSGTCTFEVSDADTQYASVSQTVTYNQAKLCRSQVLASQLWRSLKCPSAKRNLDR